MSDDQTLSSDPVLGKLARFRPSGGLDRDELLFQAGRASAGSPRIWKWGCAALASAQVVTLGLLLNRTDPPSAPLMEPPLPAIVPIEPPASPPTAYSDLARGRIEGTLGPNPLPPNSTATDAPLTISAGRRGQLVDF